MTFSNCEQLRERVEQYLNDIYHETSIEQSYETLSQQLLEVMYLDGELLDCLSTHENLWDQHDVVMITYGNSFLPDENLPRNKKPLEYLKQFLDERCDGLINSVHILPFFPYCSDDGFAVMDYSTVNEALGDWSDIQAIAEGYKLMSDLVINHCSSRSFWFENFIKGEGIGADYFVTASPESDLSDVVRPRTSPLLRETKTVNGVEHVWCTFSHDQVDLDFANPKVLVEFVRIIRLYLDMGVRIFRLDAVAFLWKKIGTTCINLDETHAIVRLLRLLVEHAQPDAIIITETNIPNRENLSYFGNANEAHWVYNFSLPPLLVNTLITGNSHHLKLWLMSMPPTQAGTTYFNFIASHDGIGLRPLEDLLDDAETKVMIETMQQFGGQVSWRALSSGESKPYEINIALFDALKGTINGEDQWGVQRFICAHAVMLALEGVPGIYVHSLLGTRNDYMRMESSGQNRCINRHQWREHELEAVLANERGHHRIVFDRLKQLIDLRQQQKAFHPNAHQYVLHLGDQFFGFWRQSQDMSQSIFCVSNITATFQTLKVADLNLLEGQTWSDLLTGESLVNVDDELYLEPYQTLWIANQSVV